MRKVDATNPSKGLSGARFLIQNANGTYSKEVVTGADGTYTLSPLDANTYSITELEAPEGYQIDNPGPQYVVLPNENGKTVTVTFTDTPEITSEGSIRKVDADDPTKGLAGAVIKIEGVDNSFTGTYTTGEGGYDLDAIQAYPVEDGAEYSIRIYTVAMARDEEQSHLVVTNIGHLFES